MESRHDKARTQRLNAQFHVRNSQRVETSARRFLDFAIEESSMEMLFHAAIQSIAQMCLGYYDAINRQDISADFVPMSGFLSKKRIVVTLKTESTDELMFWVNSGTTVRVKTRTYGHRPEVIVLHRLLRRLRSDVITDGLPKIVVVCENGLDELRFAD